MRLIDADKLEDYTDDKYSLGDIGRYERDCTINALKYAPTIDAEPVKHAEWVERQEFPDWEYCSNCGTGTRRIYREYDEKYHIWSEDHYGYQYCPHCGAKMDEEAEE